MALCATFFFYQLFSLCLGLKIHVCIHARKRRTVVHTSTSYNLYWVVYKDRCIHAHQIKGAIDAIRQYSNVNGSLVATGLACMQTGFMHTCKCYIRWFVFITKSACCSAATPNVLEKRMLIWVTSSKNLCFIHIAYLNMVRLTHSSQIIIAAACMYACRACFNLLMEVPYTTVCEWWRARWVYVRLASGTYFTCSQADGIKFDVGLFQLPWLSCLLFEDWESISLFLNKWGGFSKVGM